MIRNFDYSTISTREKVVITIFALFLPFVLTYFTTSWRAAAASQSNVVRRKHPPTLPYTIPWLGHVFEFLADGGALLAKGA
jgi:hypothetical protein